MSRPWTQTKDKSPMPAGNEFQPLPMAGLPIFRHDYSEYAAFYAPRCLYVAALADAERFQATIAPTHLSEGAKLWQRAEAAVAEANHQRRDPFHPVCLTLYMNNECNLNCIYCHTDPVRQATGRLEVEAIAAAAQVVAASCRQEGVPFYMVLHGGGEPTLHRNRVESALTLLEAAAEQQGVEPFRYVATNGLMSERKAAWLAGRFDLIGLSCDGPPDIHDRQRPRWNGRGSLRTVERTARVLHQAGAHLHVRTTITQASLARQAEIAEYICQQLAPEEIHFEPVYRGGRTGARGGLPPEQAGEFAAHFLAARRVAQGYGIPLLSSGSRPGAIHGPYCHVFRGVLNLVPGGLATACFKLTEAKQVRGKGAVIGRPDRHSGRFTIDQGRVEALREQLDVTLPDCADCFNRYHCARQCPDCCPLDGDVAAEPGFRCLAQRAIALGILHETAGRLWAEMQAGQAEGPHGTDIS
jgi:uncharacterized protein